MKNYTVSIYLTIEADTEKEAREIVFGLEIVPNNKAHEYKVFWDSVNTEIEEETR